MNLAKEQIFEQMSKHSEKKNGLHDLMEFIIERIMLAEHGEYLKDNKSDKGNGFRPIFSFGTRHKLEFRIPRTRYGGFYPQILAILRDQEEEYNRLAGTLFSKQLTQAIMCHILVQ